MHELLLEISRPYMKETDSGKPKKRVRCLGSKGCHTTWKWPRARQRIFKHAKDCKYLPNSLHRRVCNEMAKNAAGPEAQIIGTDSESGAEGHGTKRARTEPAIAATSKSGTTFKPFFREGKKALQNNADHALLLLITCCGVPPNVVSSKEFRNFVSVLNPDYHSPSESTLSDRLIPDEAANIDRATISYLKTCRNLTITFDGGKLRRAKGLYSVHITTAERRTFCMTLDDASCLSHTGNYVAELLSEYINAIGPYNFSGSCSDNTGNTSKGRRLTSEVFRHILNLQDAPHELDLTIENICSLPYFKPVGSTELELGHWPDSVNTTDNRHTSRDHGSPEQGYICYGAI